MVSICPQMSALGHVNYMKIPGRVLEVFTDQPVCNFTVGNFDGSYCGKIEGLPIGYREALALKPRSS